MSTSPASPLAHAPRGPFQLFLFDADPRTARAAHQAGVDGAIVDWETRGKHARQAGYDTQINRATREDLRQVRAATDGIVICRVNEFHAETFGEIEAAIADGADEVLLPMVRRVGDVEAVLEHARGRCGVGVMIELQDTLDIAETLARLPLARAYIGLNDLCIDRKSPHLFTPVIDGTLAKCRAAMGSVPVGFGGLTLPALGHPISCRLLMSEMVRLDCAFSILRRSFLRDTAGRDLGGAITEIRAALAAGRERAPEQVQGDMRALYASIVAMPAARTRADILGTPAQAAPEMSEGVSALAQSACRLAPSELLAG